MPHANYKLPLRLDLLVKKQRQETCTLRHSIAQNLHLIISTYRGESAYSEAYGCSLWDEEFNIQLNPRWKENLLESLKTSMLLFEKRLQAEDVKISLVELNETVSIGNTRVRKCLNVEIKGTIKKLNESFHFRDSIYISPVAQK